MQVGAITEIVIEDWHGGALHLQIQGTYLCAKDRQAVSRSPFKASAGFWTDELLLFCAL